MNGDVFESQAAFDEANAAEWRDMLINEWSRPFVSLTSAVYFVASHGLPVEQDDDDLERAASKIVRRLQDGELVAFGKGRYYDALATISRDEVSSATLDGAPFLDPSRLDAALHLAWAVIPGGDDDRIESRSAVRWQAVSIRRSDLAGLLSPVIAGAQGRAEPMASETDKRQRGPLPKKLNQIVAAMLADLEGGFPLIGALEKELSERYGASRGTCRKARKLAESEFVRVSILPNSAK